MLTEHPLLKQLGSFPLYNLKHQVKKFISIDMHPWLLTLERALESYISSEDFVSEYDVTGDDAGKGSLLAALSEAGFLIGLKKN